MKRSAPLRRGAPLRRITELARSPFRRTSVASQGGAFRRRPTGPTLSATQLVMARAAGLCEIGAEAHGWLLPAGAAPAEQPLMYRAGTSVVFLRDDGTLADRPPAVSA